MNGAGILLTSVIHTGVRPFGFEEPRVMTHSQSVTQSIQLAQLSPIVDPTTAAATATSVAATATAKNKLNLPIPSYVMSRSVTCSTLQTDI